MPRQTDAPDQIYIFDAREGLLEYTRAKEFIAVHAPPNRMPAGAAPLLEDGSIGVFDAADDTLNAGPVGPVYRPAGQPGDATLTVPTGRVLVRFESGTAAEARSHDIAQAGYRIEETLPHAPNAAWVRATDGSIATALLGLGRLETLPRVERVEPQLIRAATRR